MLRVCRRRSIVCAIVCSVLLAHRSWASNFRIRRSSASSSLTARSRSFGGYNRNHQTFGLSVTVDTESALSPILVRGGSTAVQPSSKSNDNDEAEKLRAYRLQQQLYLQSRSLQLRQALISRGFDELQHAARDPSAVVSEIDWDCALSTDEYPKSCLYSFDAETGSKVLAPVNTTAWITLSALNRLRRNDPTKIEPLWHSQYHILRTWLSPSHKYSFYTHLNPVGTVLALLLDAPWLLSMAIGATLLLMFLATFPLWESLIQTFVCSSLVWRYWPHWGRWVHAALPLKLLMAQMSFKGVAKVLGKIYGKIRTQLVEWECRIMEDCIPLTIMEGVEEDVAASEEVYDLEEEDEDEGYSDDSESESDY